MNQVSVTAKNRKYTAIAWALAILVLAVAIPVNLIFDRLNINFDMTPNSTYTLTDTTNKYLNMLDEKGVVVDVYFLEEMDKLAADNSVLDLYQTLLNYDAHPCFNLVDFDPDTNPQLMKEINPDNVFNLRRKDFFFRYNGMTKHVQGGTIYMQQNTQTSTGEIVNVNEEFRAEMLMTGSMMSVVEGILPNIYFLQGHGEHDIADFSTMTRNLANVNYKCHTLNIMTDTQIPDDASIIVIAAPQLDITDDEYDKLFAFTKKGGNIIMLMNPNNAKVSYKNISRIMESFCIGMNYDKIHESDSAKHKSNDPFTFQCELAPPSGDADQNDDLTTELKNGEKGGLLTFMPASRSFFSIYGENFSSCSVDSLIQTYTTAVSEPFGGTIEDPEEKTGHEMTVAMYSRDSLRDNAKIAVFGSAEFMTDDAYSSEFFIIPTFLFTSVISWMQDSDIDVNIPKKESYFDTIRVTSTAEAKTLLVIFVGYPLLIAAVGVIIWLRRKDA